MFRNWSLQKICRLIWRYFSTSLQFKSWSVSRNWSRHQGILPSSRLVLRCCWSINNIFCLRAWRSALWAWFLLSWKSLTILNCIPISKISPWNRHNIFWTTFYDTNLLFFWTRKSSYISHLIWRISILTISEAFLLESQLTRLIRSTSNRILT